MVRRCIHDGRGTIYPLNRTTGPNAHLAPQQLFDALVATDIAHQRALQPEQIRLPTIRIVKAGTFSAYRLWRAEMLNMSSGQAKISLVLMDPAAQAWILDMVVQEL